MILVTNCRRPTQKTRSFVKDIAGSHPNVKSTARGKLGLEDVMTAAQELGSSSLLLVSRCMGEPRKKRFLGIDAENRSYPTTYIKEVKLRREYGNRRTGFAEIVTIPKDLRVETAKFAIFYSEFFGMKLLDSNASRYNEVSIHITDCAESIRVAITSPSTIGEVGTTFITRRIDWG